jgi:NAD(P)-dependent dehydrogenase (short-subunit alcohol dehydrogenase family)
MSRTTSASSASSAVESSQQAPGKPSLEGQTVVVIGGSSGIGLETARLAHSQGADVIVTGRNPERLRQAGVEVEAVRTAAFDATDEASLDEFFESLTAPVDHVFVTAGGSYYARLADMDFAEVSRALNEHLLLPLQVAHHAPTSVRPGGTLAFMTGTAARRAGLTLAIAGVFAQALPGLVANLALEVAPVRVNLIAAGFVDTPLSASIMGADLDKRREELRATLPVRRVVEPTDVAALAVYLMTNTALTGATFDIDGGQQLLAE